MKVSLDWLKEFVDIRMKTEELAERLALSVVEVEGIIKFSDMYKSVLVGEIKEIKKHPNGDNLSVAKVSVGKKKIQIIVGSLTLEVGTKLPIIVAPTKLPNGMMVEKRNIRGIESEGMIGSNKELGLDHNEGEITFFDKNVKAGTPLAKALELEDTILDLDVLSNRPDLFSHLGVAREIAAITSQKLKSLKTLSPKKSSKKKISNFLEVEIKDTKLCPRYEARVIENVTIKESPKWMKNRLFSLGVRPVNNIVDITNYVMMELGQPLHAYDYVKLSGGKKKKIVVRVSKSGEEITTLDDKKRRLSKDILVITDSKKPIGVAGIMGGKNTEISPDTKTIILEAANFSWPAIRKASRLLGLRSEAVNRFEKGLDHNLTSTALDRAAQLISELAGGEVVSEKIDANHSKEKEKTIEVSVPKINKILVKELTHKSIIPILESLGIKAKEHGDFINATVPSFRSDLKEDVDIIEEIARIIGYDKIKTTMPSGNLVPPQRDKAQEIERKVKNIMRGFGGYEVFTYTFIGEELINAFGDNISGYYELKHPLKPEQTYLRKNLAYSLFDCAKENSKNFSNFLLFEVAKTFQKTTKMPTEEKKLGMVFVGKNSFFETKGIIESLFEYLNFKKISFIESESEIAYLHPRKAVMILSGGEQIGLLGEIHPEIVSRYQEIQEFCIAEINFEALIKNSQEPTYTSYSKYPSVSLDIAIVVDERTKEADIRKAINDVGGKMVAEIELFDVYRGKQIGTGEKSLAYHLYYQSKEKTLTEDEVKEVHEKILQKLKKEFKATLRG